MQLFKNTNFDFLGKKWIFITLSLVVTAAGVGSLIVKGGPSYGIDFRGGAEVRIRFNQEPPVEKIRSALSGKVGGEISVQQITGAQELMITTEIKDEKELNANRQAIDQTLLSLFGDSSGKLDVNNSSVAQLTDRLRDPLLQAGAALSEQQLQDVAAAIESYRNANGGILRSFDEVSKVNGVTPQVIDALKKECILGPFTILSADVVGPKVGAELRTQAILATLYALGALNAVRRWYRPDGRLSAETVATLAADTVLNGLTVR